MTQLHALIFAVVASLLCLPAVLGVPQPKHNGEKKLYKVPKGGDVQLTDSFKKIEDVEISFPPPNPSGSCQICNEEDGCFSNGHFLYQDSYTTENGYAWRADSEDYGWWAAQMNRTYPHRQSFAIVNNLKPKTRANLFEVVSIDYSQKIHARQNTSVWTKVDPGTSCLTSFQGAMKSWQDHMTVVNVYQSIHKLK